MTAALQLGNMCLTVAIALLVMVRAQSLNELSGDNIVSLMQTFGDKCPATTSIGQNWAPLPAETACGKVKRCDFPNQWCAFKLGADGNPDLGTLNCQALSPDCKKAFQDSAGGASPSPGGSTEAGGSTPAGGGGGPNGSLPMGSKGTSPAPGGATTAVTPSMGGNMSGPVMGGESSMPPGASETSMAPSETPPGVTQPPPDNTSEQPIGGGAGGEMGNGTGPGTPPPPTEIPPAGNGSNTGGGGGIGGECCDYHEFCCFWASSGQCDSNKPFMVQICQKSCGTCGCNGDPTTCSVSVASSCSGGNVPPGPACPCKSGDLVNKDWNAKCRTWADKGDCDKNAQYMKAMCKMSCNVCT